MKVSVIGACIKDEILKIDMDRLYNGSASIKERLITFGGDALNEAIDLSALGIDTKIFTILGNDDDGDDILVYLDDRDIDTSHIGYKDIKTAKNIVLVDDDGQRYFITDPDSALRKLSIDDIDFDELEGIVSFASVFVSPLLDIDKMTSLFKKIKDRGHILCCDFTKAKNKEKLTDIKDLVAYIDYLFINEEELKILNDDDYIANAHILLKYGAKNIIVKRGKDGAYLLNEDDELDIKADKCDVISTSGAGDGFVAGFIYGLCHGHDLERCLYLANKAGGIIASKLSNHLDEGDVL